MEVKILHLYYDLMNLYGEYGNIKILEEHLKNQNFDVIIDKKTLNEDKNLNEYDIIYMGCGTESNQKVALEDLRKDKDNFKQAIENDKIIILTGNSFELLGSKISDVEGLNLFDFETEINDKRIINDVICTSSYFTNKIVRICKYNGKCKK